MTLCTQLPRPGQKFLAFTRVAEVGSLSARAKMVTKILVRRAFAIFATNVSFLRVVAKLQI